MDMKDIIRESMRDNSPLKIKIKKHHYTKAEIILREDIQDFRQEGMSEDEILKAFIAAIWSLL